MLQHEIEDIIWETIKKETYPDNIKNKHLSFYNHVLDNEYTTKDWVFYPQDPKVRTMMVNLHLQKYFKKHLSQKMIDNLEENMDFLNFLNFVIKTIDDKVNTFREENTKMTETEMRELFQKISP